MINWNCNICESNNQNEKEYFHRELGICKHCECNVRFRAIWHFLDKYIFQPNANNQLKKVLGIGLSDAELYAQKLSKLVNYQNTYYHQAPFLDVSDFSSASNYSDLDFIICSDVLEHVNSPVENSFKNLNSMLKINGYLIFSVPYFTDAISKESIEHFEQHKNNHVLVEDGREYLITENKTAYTNLCWHGGPGSVLERRVFAETALKKLLLNSGFEVIDVCNDIPDLGIVYNMKGSKVMICKKNG